MSRVRRCVKGFATVSARPPRARGWFLVSLKKKSIPRHAGLSDLKTHDVGFVGAGQWRGMAGEGGRRGRASRWPCCRSAPDDAACAVAAEVPVIGSAPRSSPRLRALADAATSSPSTTSRSTSSGSPRSSGGGRAWPCPPGVDVPLPWLPESTRGYMRAPFLGVAGIPVPAHTTVTPASVPVHWTRSTTFAKAHGWPIILKTTRGGYDGKGVWPLAAIWPRPRPRGASLRTFGGGTLPARGLDAPSMPNWPSMVARRPGGESVAWPAVETAQVGGVCREVLVPGPPGSLDVLLEAASELGPPGRRTGRHGRGSMAVELRPGGQLLINEVATRPPQFRATGRSRAPTTSQFENHLRAVMDLPLGSALP